MVVFFIWLTQDTIHPISPVVEVPGSAPDYETLLIPLEVYEFNGLPWKPRLEFEPADNFIQLSGHLLEFFSITRDLVAFIGYFTGGSVYRSDVHIDFADYAGTLCNTLIRIMNTLGRQGNVA